MAIESTLIGNKSGAEFIINYILYIINVLRISFNENINVDRTINS